MGLGLGRGLGFGFGSGRGEAEAILKTEATAASSSHWKLKIIDENALLLCKLFVDCLTVGWRDLAC